LTVSDTEVLWLKVPPKVALTVIDPYVATGVLWQISTLNRLPNALWRRET